MINKYIKNIFNFINYFTLACIIPIGYFAPLGEWLLLSLLSITTLLNIFINHSKVIYNNLFIFSISILIIFISYFWSINPERTSEVIGPISGIIIAIFIVLNITQNNKILNIENLIGIPLIITSLCIFLDMIFNTEIRSYLAMLAGDAPTSRSANFGRGIIILLTIMPFSVAMYINKGKILLALGVLMLVSTIVILGPNHSAKIALIITVLSSIIIYFLGPRSFLYFGIISIIFILFLPIISSKILPPIGSIEKNNYYDVPWQKTAIGGSIIHRLLVWEYVAKEIYKRPILGHGIGTSRLIGQNIILNVPNTNQEIKGGIPLHPHNNFLEIWLELGLLGIIIINILWIKIIKYGIQMRKDSYIIGTGICSSIVTIFIISNLSFGVFQAWWMSIIALIFLIILQFNKQE
ncbi:MAG: O-antigen ligase family protein [Alphaproteobacteria bacterium]|nr:O-antigen ligase family protein [Alphaproteobacteria bacterium]